MIQHAVNGHVPLIRCTTDDLIHVEYLLEQTFPKLEVNRLGYKHASDIYYVVGVYEKDLTDLYNDAEENEYTVIFINTEAHPSMLECGEFLPDKKLVYEFLLDNLPPHVAKEAPHYLVGLTYQSIKQVLSLCPVWYDTISVDSLRATKNRIKPQQVGVVPVNTDTDFFFNLASDISHWININKDYMFTDVDTRLVPKGMLLHGDAGTGKTEVARYIAREWNIPLFLLDINSMLSKWQGEAESHLNKALDTFDTESPCVVLFDEVEKLFNNNSENDTSQRLLSRILWWLQLRESKVFVIMTCNNMDIIPPELYRAGRISVSFEMLGVAKEQIPTFTTQLIKSFGITEKPLIKKAISSIKIGNKKHVPHATLNQKVIDFLQKIKHGL